MDASRFAIALFDGVEELDWVGPWEVLTVWRQVRRDAGIEVFTVADHDGPIRCARGARVLADHTWDTVPPFDVLVYPGGYGTRRQLGDDAIRSRIRAVAANARIMASVCTGSLVYADAGLLDGRAATTHWKSLDLLASLGRDIEVRPDDRFVDVGDVVTAAGISAGIDMALHLVARLGSVEDAREVRRQMQYDPEPPV